MAHSTYRWYVGLDKGLRVEIRIRNSTFAQAHAARYAALVGPFKTKRAAVWFVEHPRTPLQTVNEIEDQATLEMRRRSSDGRTKSGKRVRLRK